MPEHKTAVPLPTKYSKTYWDRCKQHELVIQRCVDCGQYRFYPRPRCPKCLSLNTEWVRASGKGKVYSFSIVHRPQSAAFADAVPYTVALIELNEGVRMMSNVIGCKPEDVKIGMNVEVVFEDVTEEIALPKFGPSP